MKVGRTLSEAIDRNWRYIIFGVGALVLLWIFYSQRMVLLPFLIGIVAAYLLTPPLRWIEGHLPGKSDKRRRIIAIMVMAAVFVSIAAFLIFIAVTLLVHYSSGLLSKSDQYITQAIERLKQFTDGLRNAVPDNLRGDVDKIVQDIGSAISSTLQKSVAGGGSLVLSSVGIILGFAAVPLFLFYLLKDSELVVKSVCSTLGRRAYNHLYKVLCIIDNVLGRYVRGAFILSTVLFALTFAGMMIIRIPVQFALPLAFIYGLGELIPTLGAWIAGAVMLIVVIAVAPDKILWVILMDIIVKLIENMLLVPRIQATTMHLHPALVVLLLVLGGHFWGLWGMIFTVPVVATLADVFKYVKQINEKG